MQDEVAVKKINISFERVEEFKYLVTALTNQNSIQEDINTLLSGHTEIRVCYPMRC
jgi:hypothetical protein